MPPPGTVARDEAEQHEHARRRRTASKKLVVTPAADTRMSPRRKLRNFREFTGTGLAPPKVNRPPEPNQSSAGSSRLIQRIDVRDGIESDPTEGVGGVVALLERGRRAWAYSCATMAKTSIGSARMKSLI